MSSDDDERPAATYPVMTTADSSALPILDENMSSPFYGLPAIRMDLHRLISILAAVWDGWLERDLQPLPALFAPGGARLTNIIVSGRLNTVSAAIWNLILESFPTLQGLQLELRVEGVFPNPLFNSLCAPIATLPGGERREVPCVRCPALASLAMPAWVWGNDAMAVLACLHARAALRAPKLRLLRLLKLQGNAWERLRQRLHESVERFED